MLGSGLLGKLDPSDAITAMFDIAEDMIEESERRYDRDRNKGAAAPRTVGTGAVGKDRPKNKQDTQCDNETGIGGSI